MDETYRKARAAHKLFILERDIDSSSKATDKTHSDFLVHFKALSEDYKLAFRIERGGM